MRNLIETQGGLITNQVPETAQWLQDFGLVVMPFGGKHFYAWFSTPEKAGLLAEVKQRNVNGHIKPFVRVGDASRVDMLVDLSGIDEKLNPRVLDIAKKILLQSEVIGQPLGILLPASNSPKVDPLFLGTGVISVADRKYNTVGMMVSAPDEHFTRVLDTIERSYIVGTSANYSSDPRDGGSGHHETYGVVRDFAEFAERNLICISVPLGREVGKGPSTTVVFVSPEGIAYLVRVGSTPADQMKYLIESNNIHYGGEVDGGAKYINPYNYNKDPFLERILNEQGYSSDAAPIFRRYAHKYVVNGLLYEPNNHFWWRNGHMQTLMKSFREYMQTTVQASHPNPFISI